MHDSNFLSELRADPGAGRLVRTLASEGVNRHLLANTAPPSPDWTMYRGWYKGQREWGSARVPWILSGRMERNSLRRSRLSNHEARSESPLGKKGQTVRAGNVCIAGLSESVGSDRFDDGIRYSPCISPTTGGVSHLGGVRISPWITGPLKLRAGVGQGPEGTQVVDWENLQRPGSSPDYLDQQVERMDIGLERSDWVATAAAQAPHSQQRAAAGLPGRQNRRVH